MSNSIQIIIADDHSIMADGYEKVIHGNTDHTVVAKVGNGKLLLQVLNRTVPHLIILDLNMPEMDGLETAAFIKRRHPSIKILVISMYEDLGIKNKLLDMGIEGYISKTTDAAQLLDAIDGIMNGGVVYQIKSTQNSVPQQYSTNDSFRMKHKLSSREVEIIILIKEGKSSKEISKVLYLSEYTVETHRKNIFKKTNVKSMGELIKWAVDNQL